MVMDLEGLRRRRDRYRGRSTNAVNTAQNVITGLTLTPAQLQGQVDLLQRLQTTLEDYDNQILDQLTEADELDAEINEAGTYADPITTTISTLKEAKAELLTRTSDTGTTHAVNVNAIPAAVTIAGQGSAQAVARLPQLELPKFSGNPLQWSSFWNSYESAIDSNNRLSDVDKFNYLRSLLKGIALDSIAGIAITNANYASAVTLVRNRFGQRQAIVNAHVEALVNMPKAAEDTGKLRSLYDNAEIHVRGLETLGITSAQNGDILTPILLAKIPDDIRLIITRKNEAPIGDLDRLRELLRVEVEARELSLLPKKPVSKTHRESEGEFTSGSLVNTAGRARCYFCHDWSHKAVSCPRYPTCKDRESKALKDRLCLNCLGTGHRRNDCSSNYKCQVCHEGHHTALCPQGSINGPQKYSKPKWNPRRGKNSNVNVANTEEDAPVSVSASPTLLSNTSSVWMQTAIAKVPDTAGTLHEVRLLLDTGSDRSYVTSALADKLSLEPISSVILSIAPFGRKRSSSKRFDVTEFQCLDSSGQHRQQLSAVIVPTITCPIYRTDVRSPTSALMNLKLADPPKHPSEWMNVDILIGLDYYWQLVQDEIIRLPDEGLIAMSSVFGWLVSGTIRDGREHFGHAMFTNAIVNICATSIPDNKQLTKFWESESLKFADLPSKEKNVEQDLVLQRSDETITMHENRYEVGLPWKEDGPDLPSNYQLSIKRFRSLITRLHREDIMTQYNDVIADQLKRGFIERVEDANTTNGIVHYIPHHPVIKQDHTTTKLRIVYDASAKRSENDPSLNDSLCSGPNLITDLLALLLEFREQKIVLLADIEKAFLQVGLHPVDRDATRFFWLKDPTKPSTDDNLAVYRFCRVPFGATSSPFLLAATLRYHLMHTDSAAAKKMLGHFYVDNLVTGTTKVTEATTFYADAKRIMSDIGMNLREWVSNSAEFVESIPEIDRAKGNIVNVLGIPWNVKEDLLYVKGVPILVTNGKPTKRQILQTIAKVFDPLGLVPPVVIKAKIFIQSLWKANIPWDDVPAPKFLEQWDEINAQLSALDAVKVSRRLKITDNSQLHVFVDASSKAYATVAYIRTPVDDSSNEYITSLICSKSRVAPVKSITMPRLELMAALVGCQVADFLQKTFAIRIVQLWSDSEIVLHWIANPNDKQGVFVSNRLKTIKEHCYQFRYVPTKENPADLPSRGTDTKTLLSSIWWKGPAWLSQTQQNWPTNCWTLPAYLPSHEDQTAKNSYTEAICTKLTTKVPKSPFGIDVQRFSSLSKLLRVTSLCSRFIDCLRKRPSGNGPVTIEEYASARRRWIKFVQHEHYGDQIDLLRKKRSDNAIKNMRLFMDDEILKCQGRFNNSTVSADTNCPTLLPKLNKFTDLIIVDQHEKLYHQGVRYTLSALRQAFWIPSGRQQVRVVLRGCRICRLWEGKSYSSPCPPPLPSMRVTNGPAFSYTGCDFAGPLYAFQGGTSTKVYICLFTCAVTRAIHLELVEDLTTSCFIMALRRFISRRGFPKEIISDNAKTFKMSKEVLDRLWHDIVVSDETTNYVATQGIKWKFNVERAPWWGGFFEKMVGLTKRTLINAIGRAKLSSVELATVLAEIEAILNCRPLTYVYDDLASGSPLCPANFLSEAVFFALPSLGPSDKDPEYKDRLASTNALINKLRLKQQMLDRFWKIWLNEYLPNLREYHQQQRRMPRNNPYVPQIGDVVLIKQDGLKRAHWKLGIIQYLFPGRDDQVRAVQLKLKDGQLLQRPITLVYPLEIKTQPSSTPQNENKDRPHKERRQSALQAEQRIKDIHVNDAQYT